MSLTSVLMRFYGSVYSSLKSKVGQKSQVLDHNQLIRLKLEKNVCTSISEMLNHQNLKIIWIVPISRKKINQQAKIISFLIRGTIHSYSNDSYYNPIHPYSIARNNLAFQDPLRLHRLKFSNITYVRSYAVLRLTSFISDS